MPQIPIKDWNNKTVRTIDLDEDVFNYPMKSHLVYEAVCAYQNAGRAGTAKTKNRVDVSGGTRKLWKQKGTGRARMGDNRSPLWRHGGTVHGPQPRSYAWSFPRKMRRNAIKCALSEMIREGNLVVVDKFDLATHRTAELEKSVSAGLGLEKKTLLLSLEEDKNLSLAARNNPRLSVNRALGVNIVELLDSDKVVISEEALLKLGEVLS